jgi:3-ketosteroid 9alpha-monooxygenase subunit B
MSASGETTATAVSVGAEGPYHALRIGRIVEETADARSFVLEIPDSLRDAFAYRSGQFLTFRIPVAGERLVRCYSLASSPGVDSEHKVTVKRIEEGRVSNWMNESLAVGDTLETMRPAGIFCLQERSTPLVLFGGGSGITPLVSIVKTALATTSRSLRLLYVNRDRESIIFREELDALAARYPDRFELIHRLDDEHGFADAEVVKRVAGDVSEADFYVCGPGLFMDIVEETLRSLGVASERFFIERFVSLSGGEEGETSPAVAPAEGDATPATIAVTLDGETREIPYVAGQTILEAARAAGMEPPFACEEGYCSCCMAKLAEGRVRMNMNDALDDEQVGEGWVLTCQSVPQTQAIKIEYPD